MNLPLSRIEQLAKGITLVLDSRIYKVDHSNGCEENYLEFDGNKLPLIELDTAYKLELLEEDFDGDDIADVIMEKFDDEQELLSNKKVQDEFDEEKIMDFLLHEVFVHFESTRTIESMTRKDITNLVLTPSDVYEYSRNTKNYFTTQYGTQVNSIEELVDAVKEMNPKVVRNHLMNSDFYTWVGNVIGDKVLATRITKGTNKAYVLNVLRDRIDEYHNVLDNQGDEEVKEKVAKELERRNSGSSFCSMIKKNRRKSVDPDTLSQRELHNPKVDNSEYDYKEGDHVRLIRHLGVMKGLDDEFSYSGIHKKELPLGSKGRVENLDGDELLVSIEGSDFGTLEGAKYKIIASKPKLGWGQQNVDSIGVLKRHDRDIKQDEILILDFEDGDKNWAVHIDDAKLVESSSKIKLHKNEVRKYMPKKNLEADESIFEKTVRNLFTDYYVDQSKVLLIDNFLFALTDSHHRDSQPDAKLNYKGDDYFLYLIGTKKDLFEKYDQNRTGVYRKKFMSNQPKLVELRERMVKYENAMKIFRDNKRYRVYADRIDKNNYNLVLRLPDFINQGDDGNYFLFKGLEVHMQISAKKEGFNYGEMLVSPTHSHPFTGEEVTGKNICFGDFNFNIYSDRENADQIAARLRKAEDILLRGYKVPPKVTPRNHLEDNKYYRKNIIDKDEAMELHRNGRAYITNINVE